MSKTTVRHVIGIDGAILRVFHIEAHCWQFRLISDGGEVFGERKIYYTAEAALLSNQEGLDYVEDCMDILLRAWSMN